MPSRHFLATLTILWLALPAWPADLNTFVPAHVLPGIGVGRHELSEESLALRTNAMIQSQTFSIMREPQAAAGARRIYDSHLQSLFQDAEKKTGFPASVLQAIAYLESWGDPKAESPAGPRGIMQISEATGKRMGLKISYSVRHRTVKTKTMVRNKHGKMVARTVKHKETYTVLTRDDRFKPEKVIPAAAAYLAGMEHRYGGQDWAIWAYHCGEGCVSDFLSLARATKGLDVPQASVAKVFFECSPVWNRELYEAVHAQMDRDYSPTYWFRIMRAEQLLHVYLDDPAEFRDLVDEYRYIPEPSQRAPDRLAVWLKPQDLIYETREAIVGQSNNKLTAPPDDPAFFGYRVCPGSAGADDACYAAALPATIGTLAYIAYETRRLYRVMRPDEDTFVPLDVTAMTLPSKSEGHIAARGGRMMEHSSGQVFDISTARLPGGEKQSLQFVLDDLGWNGYLGFIEAHAAGQTLHVGCSPAARDFFSKIFDDQVTALRDRPTTAPAAPVAQQ